MGNEEHTEAIALLQRFEQKQNLRLHGDVQGGRGLIGDQQQRPVHQRHGDQHALSLASGKLVGIVARPLLRLGNRHCGHGFQNGFAYLLAAQLRLVGFDGFGNLPPHRHHRD